MQFFEELASIECPPAIQTKYFKVLGGVLKEKVQQVVSFYSVGHENSVSKCRHNVYISRPFNLWEGPGMQCM